jgi:hypothetical protein
MMTDVLSIADKFIREGVHWQNNRDITPRYKAQELECRWKKIYNTSEGIALYFN